MSSKQLALPGMELTAPPKPKKISVSQQIANLEQRLIQLEAEVTMLRYQIHLQEAN